MSAASCIRNNAHGRNFVANLLYCLDLLTDSATALSDTVELRVDGEVLEAPIVINYTLESIGNEAITNCRVQICTRKSDQIVRAQVLVQSELQCERIKFQEEIPTKVKLTWTHINPGDMIIIALLVSPCEDARCVRLEVDAEGLEVENRQMQEDCSVEVPSDLHRADSENGLP